MLQKYWRGLQPSLALLLRVEQGDAYFVFGSIKSRFGITFLHFTRFKYCGIIEKKLWCYKYRNFNYIIIRPIEDHKWDFQSTFWGLHKFYWSFTTKMGLKNHSCKIARWFVSKTLRSLFYSETKVIDRHRPTSALTTLVLLNILNLSDDI